MSVANASQPERCDDGDVPRQLEIDEAEAMVAEPEFDAGRGASEIWDAGNELLRVTRERMAKLPDAVYFDLNASLTACEVQWSRLVEDETAGVWHDHPATTDHCGRIRSGQQSGGAGADLCVAIDCMVGRVLAAGRQLDAGGVTELLVVCGALLLLAGLIVTLTKGLEPQGERGVAGMGMAAALGAGAIGVAVLRLRRARRHRETLATIWESLDSLRCTVQRQDRVAQRRYNAATRMRGMAHPCQDGMLRTGVPKTTLPGSWSAQALGLTPPSGTSGNRPPRSDAPTWADLSPWLVEKICGYLDPQGVISLLLVNRAGSGLLQDEGLEGRLRSLLGGQLRISYACPQRRPMLELLKVVANSNLLPQEVIRKMFSNLVEIVYAIQDEIEVRSNEIRDAHIELLSFGVKKMEKLDSGNGG